MRQIFTLSSFIVPALLVALVSAVDSSSSLSSSSATSSSGVYASSATQCELCRDTGRCSRAYKESPGKHCYSYYHLGEYTPCCCAEGDECASASFSYCVCHTPIPDDHLFLYAMFGVFSVGMIVFCVRVCHRLRRPVRDYTYDENRGAVYVQTIVYSQSSNPPQQQGFPPQEQGILPQPLVVYQQLQQQQQQQQHNQHAPVYSAGYAPNYVPSYYS